MHGDGRVAADDLVDVQQRLDSAFELGHAQEAVRGDARTAAFSIPAVM